MHKNAEDNYGTGENFTNEPIDLSSLSDKTIVLSLWGNTRYQRMTGDTHIEQASSNLRARWSKFADAKSDADWRDLRLEFESSGWQ